MNSAAIAKATQLIKGFEGLRLTAYSDSGGVLTIGYGHTHGVKKGQTCTEAEADAFLAKDMTWVIYALNPIVEKFGLGINESAALISLAFNVGVSAIIKKNRSIYRALANGTRVDVAKAMRLWNKANGQVVQGLVNRRNKEAEVFLTEDL